MLSGNCWDWCYKPHVIGVFCSFYFFLKQNEIYVPSPKSEEGGKGRLSHLMETWYKFNKYYVLWMEKEDGEGLRFLLQTGNIRLFLIWWWPSVWGGQEQWNTVCVCYLGISMYPRECVHSWGRKLLSLLLLVYKQTAWGLLACCMEPTTGLVNNWDIFHLVFHMSEHRKKGVSPGRTVQ